MAVDWTQPPPGIVVISLGESASTLRDLQIWRAATDNPPPAPWPAEWRALMAAWIKAAHGDSTTWKKLLEHTQRAVGSSGAFAADEVLLALAIAGYAELDVRRIGRMQLWLPVTVRWLRQTELRRLLGLKDRRTERNNADTLLTKSPAASMLYTLHESLADYSATVIVRRHALVRALDVWLREQRVGTFRDLAQLARDDTKDITASERDWLAAHLDLPTIGLEDHQPVYWLAGGSRLGTGHGTLLDLPALPGFAALSISALRSVSRASPVARIVLIENRTSFERRAMRRAGDELIIWLPGYVGSRWFSGLQHLLRRLPAPCHIAADCDPWGVEIAWRCGIVCAAEGLAWHPSQMDSATLRNCNHRLPLTSADRNKLQRLLALPLPPALLDLCRTMDEMGEKAEQEQYI